MCYYGYPMYGYGYGNNQNENYSFIWGIIIVVFILFILFGGFNQGRPNR